MIVTVRSCENMFARVCDNKKEKKERREEKRRKRMAQQPQIPGIVIYFIDI